MLRIQQLKVPLDYEKQPLARHAARALRLPVWRQRLRGAIANPFHMNRVQGAMRAWDHPSEDKP